MAACPRCGREFASDYILVRHRNSVSTTCRYTDAERAAGKAAKRGRQRAARRSADPPAFYVRYLEREVARRAEARSGNECRWCGASIARLKATARYCSVAHQKRWLYEHGGREARGHVLGGQGIQPGRVKRIKRPPAELPPIPVAPVGHELFDRGRAALKGWEAADFDRDMDSGAADLVAEFVLAELEGRDGLEAMAELRRRHGKDRKVLVHGLARVDDLVR